MRSQLSTWALLFTVAIAVAAAQQAAPDPTQLGPQVGDPIPDFALPDTTGRTWTPDSIMGPNGAMLVFVRSANW